MPPASPLRSSRRPAAAELDDRPLGGRPLDPGQLEHGERGGGIAAVVLAGDRELERDGLQRLAADDVRYVREPLLEERLAHLRLRAEGRVMVEVDVEEDGDLRSQGGDRAIGLVSLDDEPAAAPPPRSRRAARSRRRSGTRDRDRAGRDRTRSSRSSSSCRVRPRRRSSGGAKTPSREQVGARSPLDPAGERGRDVRPRSRPAVRAGRAEMVTSIPSRCPRYGVSTRSQPGNLGTPRMREQRGCAYAGAADTDDPDPPTGERSRGTTS